MDWRREMGYFRLWLALPTWITCGKFWLSLPMRHEEQFAIHALIAMGED